MGESDVHEAELYLRYESRIVALEYGLEGVKQFQEHYRPIVDELRDGALVAEQIAQRLRESTTLGLTKVHLFLMGAAMVVPALLGPFVTYLLIKR